jgi:general secretion pathway protein A
VYRAFFGFREKPFNLTPDPKFLYLNASYREALAALHYGVVDRKGFVSLIGEAGTGKTTLLRRLLAELPRETRSVLVINPAIGFEEMLRFILSDLGRAPLSGATKLDMLEDLNSELLDTLARGGNVVVLIDEAQDLTIRVLEELRLLSNLETAKEKILQLVLAGQPEFDGLLARSEIRQLRQRISVRARLRPLARSEVKAYVAARIAAAGGDVRGIFTPAALFRLWWFSSGVPRLVNTACDNALVNAYAAGRRTIGWREIGEAMRDLRRQVAWAPRRLAQAVMLLGAAAIGGGLMLGGMRLAGDRLGAPIPVSKTPRPEMSIEVRKSTAIDAVAAAVVGTPSGSEPTPADSSAGVGAAIAASPAPEAGEIVPAPAASQDEPRATETSTATVRVSSPTESEATPEVVVTASTAARPEGRSSRAQTGSRDPSGKLIVRVSDGDTLTDLARRYYGSAGPRVLATIKAANPGLDDPDVLWAGKVLVLPPPRLEGVESQVGGDIDR